MKALTSVLAIMPALAACSSNYSQFYTDYSAGNNYIAPAIKAPQIVNIPGTAQEVVYEMYSNGYSIVGESSFNAPPEDTSAAIAQAKKVGAEYIVLRSQYTNTVSGSIPLTSQQTVTTQSQGTATAFGTGGFATGTYRGTTNTTSPVTTYLPYSVQRYDQSALFFAPMTEPCIGFYPENLTDTEKAQLGTNKGIRVAAIRKGSPAYFADILPNDYIMTINGKPFTDDIRQPFSGEVVDFGIIRGSQNISIKLSAGSGCR